ncbi:MAG: endolytic transglycosylase MltG [bacterium]|nr:endolytic transglycosylase MltG [bacterium]
MNDMHVIPRKLAVAVFLLLILAGAGVAGYQWAFGAPERGAAPERFIVPLGMAATDVPVKLTDAGLVKQAWAIQLALSLERVELVAPGGYEVSKSMSAWAIAKALRAGPYMRWVVIPEGLRKEEIAEILATTLEWSAATKRYWISTDTAPSADYAEGVYFPDTYLIALTEPPTDVANRLRRRFEEQFAPLAAEARTQNVRWPTLLKVASIVQREAASHDDMPLIAGILWNRLLVGMRLQVDATVQYARGNVGNGWWAPLAPGDRDIDSPYNTYRYAGLPPRPIANSGIAAIRAVLYPATTRCLFYLHDANREIHCAVTFEEHKQNIEQYLK